MCTSRYYDIQKIKSYQKLELQYDSTIGILHNSVFETLAGVGLTQACPKGLWNA